MRHNLHIMYIALLLTLAGCGGRHDAPAPLKDNDGGSGNGSERPVEFALSRSTTGGDDELKTVFTNGTEIGISVEDYNEYTNVKYKYSDGKFVPADPHKAIFIGQEKKDQMKQTTYTAYYPYQENTAAYDNPAILGDQKDKERYYASDALIATGRLDEPMKFEHRMAKAYITTNDAMDYVCFLDWPLTAGSTDLRTPYALSVNENHTEWRIILTPGKRNMKIATGKGEKTYYADFGEKELLAGSQYAYHVNIGLDLSKGDVIIEEPGEYTVIQSAGGTTNHCIKIDAKGGEATIHLQNVNIKAPTAIYATNGTATLILDTKTEVVSTGAGEPGISLGNDIKLNIEGNNQELWATGGSPATFTPAGPAIGVSCDHGNSNCHLYMVVCHFHGKVIGSYAAIIGTCGDTPKQGSRYSMMGNIDIHNSALYMEQHMTSDQGDYIGNGKIGAMGYGSQHLQVGRIELKDCVWEPVDSNLTVGKLRGTFSNGSYKVENVIVNGISYTETGYGQRPG